MPTSIDDDKFDLQSIPSTAVTTVAIIVAAGTGQRFAATTTTAASTEGAGKGLASCGINTDDLNVNDLGRAATPSSSLPKSPPSKQYCALSNGAKVLQLAIESFLKHPAIDLVLPVILKSDIGCYHEVAAASLARLQVTATSPLHALLLSPLALDSSPRRQDSVRAGLEHIKSLMHGDPHARVLIHDGCRPLVSSQLITAVVDALEQAPAVEVGLGLSDTLRGRRPTSGTLPALAPNRDDFYLVQTPQGFHLDMILELHRKYAHIDVTDDAALAELEGISLAFVPGERTNLKITESADLQLASALVTAMENLDCTDGTTSSHPHPMKKNQPQKQYRVGLGIDIHAFAATADSPSSPVSTHTPSLSHSSPSHIILGGCCIPHPVPILAHSDGDLIFHALTDAILGALGLGNIGAIFSNTDPRWKDASSGIFVAYSKQLLIDRRAKVVNIDVTVIAEMPKIMPHAAAIKENIATLLEISPADVNVKAVTPEGLGSLGRKEGIAAHVICQIEIDT